jgi:molybdopterin-guanine dinucleotide biosynthesis protein
MIIAFAGRKQSGKTTSCEFIQSLLPNQETKIYNFADPLKHIRLNRRTMLWYR